MHGELKLGGPSRKLTAKECLEIAVDMTQGNFESSVPFLWAHEAFQLWVLEEEKTARQVFYMTDGLHK